jgi:hypothetical protein
MQRVTKVERRKLYAAYYDQDQKYATYEMFRHVSTRVDLHEIHEIFKETTIDDRARWRKDIRYIFLYSFEDVFHIYYQTGTEWEKLPDQKKARQMRTRWQAYSPHLHTKLRINSIDELPIPRGGVFDYGRRGMLQPRVLRVASQLYDIWYYPAFANG